ncbi:Protein lunapark [Talaromyces islandicus]|uniref:Endoplasmic reticulum junction formation protein lunapark n=1 Tax=Talaromyces islandicus TaxID=28573 RepID=A0A0U1M0G2_TALIS|nr:Protein lunapark [Talaromyces islandicus]
MVSLWPWKGEDNSPASFEKTLSTLSTKITEKTTRLDATRQQARRFRALWTLYSIFIYLLYSTIDVLVLGWKNWGPWEFGAVLGGPFIIYAVRAVGARIFDYRISKAERHLDSLKSQRDETIEKLKVATKYNSTQQLLEKYAGEPKKPKQPRNNSGASKRKDTGPKGGPPPPMIGRTGLPPPPTANIKRPQNEQSYATPTTPSPNAGASPQPPNYPHGQSLSPPPHIDEPGFAPNAFPTHPQYNDGPRWYDRFMDVLLGEDETLPKNRFALICQNCRLVNGQAPPGVKNLEELGRWRCGNCGAWNGQESEAKKVLESIKSQPPPTTDGTWESVSQQQESETSVYEEGTDDGVIVEDDSNARDTQSGHADDDKSEQGSAHEDSDQPAVRTSKRKK